MGLQGCGAITTAKMQQLTDCEGMHLLCEVTVTCFNLFQPDSQFKHLNLKKSQDRRIPATLQ